MFPKSYQWFLEEDDYSLTASSQSWSLLLMFEGGESWMVERWKSKPNNTTVEKVKELTMRGVHIYTHSVKSPDFYMKDESQ